MGRGGGFNLLPMIISSLLIQPFTPDHGQPSSEHLLILVLQAVNVLKSSRSLTISIVAGAVSSEYTGGWGHDLMISDLWS